MRPALSGERVFILGGTNKAVMDFARRHAVDLGITELGQVVSVTQPHQVRGYRGQKLFVLQDCYTRAARWYELIAYAREAGLEIVYRDCGEPLR